MAVSRAKRGGGAEAPMRALREGFASALQVRELWLVLAGALVMALAGGLAGAQVRPEGFEMQGFQGPRLRVSPIAGFTPASLSREPPPDPVQA